MTARKVKTDVSEKKNEVAARKRRPSKSARSSNIAGVSRGTSNEADDNDSAASGGAPARGSRKVAAGQKLDEQNRANAQASAKHFIAPEILIITGLSGSGMSSATNAFEDLGYFCVDNLPLTLLPTFARLVAPHSSNSAKKTQKEADAAHPQQSARIEHAALVINIRERDFLNEFNQQLANLRAAGVRVYVLFFEASDEVLVRRFSETRRPHPADTGDGLASAIQFEREAMREIRALSDAIIDTSEHNVHSLRRVLVERFNPEASGAPMRVQLISFGHKYGAARELDLLFDVRHLPNPYFVADLRALSGRDQRIIKFLKNEPEVSETLRRFQDLLEYLLPQYQREGKSYVTVGIGCTGGRHRSVMVADTLAKRLRRAGFESFALHRDIRKAK